MNLHIEIQKIRQKYSTNPETAQCMKDCFALMTEITEEITKLSEKITANRSAKRSVTAKEHNTVAKQNHALPTPLQQLISQSPPELKDDLYAIRNIMMRESAVDMLNSLFDQTTPDSERQTVGQCLDELADKHVDELSAKFPDTLPRDLYRTLYQLAVLSLTDGANIAVNAVNNQLQKP